MSHMIRNNSKIKIYQHNGQGRDSYITQNNGGFTIYNPDPVQGQPGTFPINKYKVKSVDRKFSQIISRPKIYY